MAYDFVSASSQYISASAPVTAAPLTMFAKLRRTSTVSPHYFMALSQASADNQVFLIYGSTNNTFFVQSGGSTNQVFTGLSANTWQNIGGITASSTSRYAFVDSTLSSQGTTNISPSNINTLAIGAGVLNNGPVAALNGQMAEAAIWNTNLTTDEITSLAKGFKPYRIRPQSLVFYAPLIRNLQDIRDGRALTNNNSATVTDHPRVY